MSHDHIRPDTGEHATMSDFLGNAARDAAASKHRRDGSRLGWPMPDPPPADDEPEPGPPPKPAIPSGPRNTTPPRDSDFLRAALRRSYRY